MPIIKFYQTDNFPVYKVTFGLTREEKEEIVLKFQDEFFNELKAKYPEPEYRIVINADVDVEVQRKANHQF